MNTMYGQMEKLITKKESLKNYLNDLPEDYLNMFSKETEVGLNTLLTKVNMGEILKVEDIIETMELLEKEEQTYVNNNTTVLDILDLLSSKLIGVADILGSLNIVKA